MQYQSIAELIDSGDEKFKIGLAWYVIYRIVDNKSDYHYIDLLELPTEDIKRILDEHYAYLLLDGKPPGYIMPIDYATLTSYNQAMSIIKKRRTDFWVCREEHKSSSISFIIGDYMYRLLINPDKYFRSTKRSELADLIGHAANRVIRNYQTAKILKEVHSDNCMDYIKNYHKSKGFKRTTGW